MHHNNHLYHPYKDCVLTGGLINSRFKTQDSSNCCIACRLGHVAHGAVWSSSSGDRRLELQLFMRTMSHSSIYHHPVSCDVRLIGLIHRPGVLNSGAHASTAFGTAWWLCLPPTHPHPHPPPRAAARVCQGFNLREPGLTLPQLLQPIRRAGGG